MSIDMNLHREWCVLGIKTTSVLWYAVPKAGHSGAKPGSAGYLVHLITMNRAFNSHHKTHEVRTLTGFLSRFH